ncbi:hypothetical protein FRC01_004825 [Tulasnella sp. 417]|nr:hypothetical protein FRC01_004825 [Tulasnella sp. 417]
MVAIDSPKQMSKRKIATPAVRPNPNRPLQAPLPLRTSSDPPPRIRSAALPITIPYDETVHVLDQLPRVPRNLILAGARPRVYAFAVDDIRSASLISCPTSGLVLPPKDCVPPLEEPSATDGKPKPAPRKRRKLQIDENADDDKHIPRSPNAFILWRSEVFARARSLNLAPADKARLTTQVSEEWKTTISEAIKEHYQYLAEIAKELHAQKHPDYKYCPKSAAEKAALKAIKDAKKKEAKEREREAKEAEKLAKKARTASATIPVEVPISRPVQVERLYKGYPSTAWGSEGPPQGWTPQEGLAVVHDDGADAAAGSSAATPVGSRPPSPPPKQRRPQQDFAGHPESIFGTGAAGAFNVAGVSDGHVDISFGSSSLIGQSDPAATPHGLGIDMLMDEEGEDLLSGNQLGWDMAGQLIRNGWHQTDSAAETSNFPSGIFTAQGQMNFSGSSLVPSPTETTSYLSPATISPQSKLDLELGGLSSAEHSPPPYEPPLDAAEDYSFSPSILSQRVPSKSSARAGLFAAQPKNYVPSPLGQGGAKVVDPDRPPEIPRASKPSLKNVQASAGRRATKIASTLPPVPNLTMNSAH